MIFSMLCVCIDSPASSGPDASQPEDMEGEEPTSSAHEEYYDDIYFDSSGSEDEGGGAEGIRKVGKKVRKMTDDELFYDPKMDEDDERWMKRQRMNYLNSKNVFKEVFSLWKYVVAYHQEYIIREGRGCLYVALNVCGELHT